MGNIRINAIMSDFILYSLIASVILTLVVNLLLWIFPNAATWFYRKLEEFAKQATQEQQDESTPRIRVYFPWKAMIIISIVLTVLLNLISLLMG